MPFRQGGVKMDKILLLSDVKKAKILSEFIVQINKMNYRCGTVIGSYQVLEMLEDIAIREKIIPCPKCSKIIEVN
jgi:hypothetical protein